MRVIDLTSLSGAYAARLFAESGHEVIRVEPPAGDDVRRLPPFLRGKQDLEHSAYHQFLNAHKKSVTLDLDTSGDRQIFLGLLSHAEVLIANDPLPVDEQSCLKANSKLVLTKIVDDAQELCAVARSG